MVLDCPLVVLTAGSVEMYGDPDQLKGPLVVLLQNMAGRHVDGTVPVGQVRGVRAFKVGEPARLSR
jgi:hypothetical protein